MTAAPTTRGPWCGSARPTSRGRRRTSGDLQGFAEVEHAEAGVSAGGLDRPPGLVLAVVAEGEGAVVDRHAGAGAELGVGGQRLGGGLVDGAHEPLGAVGADG